MLCLIFHWDSPLGWFRHRLAMYVCLSVCDNSKHPISENVEISGQGQIANIDMQWHNYFLSLGFLWFFGFFNFFGSRREPTARQPTVDIQGVSRGRVPSPSLPPCTPLPANPIPTNKVPPEYFRFPVKIVRENYRWTLYSHCLRLPGASEATYLFAPNPRTIFCETQT